MTKKFTVFLLTLSCAVVLSESASSAEQSEQENFFHRRVEPLIVTRCLVCHGRARKGELDLRTRQGALTGGETGPVIEPGQPNKSLLFDHVYNEEMPPKQPLSDDEVDILELWIREGAYYPDFPLDLFSITTDKRAGYDWWSLDRLLAASGP